MDDILSFIVPSANFKTVLLAKFLIKPDELKRNWKYSLKKYEAIGRALILHDDLAVCKQLWLLDFVDFIIQEGCYKVFKNLVSRHDHLYCNYMLHKAIEKGHAAIVRLLLADNRVNPSIGIDIHLVIVIDVLWPFNLLLEMHRIIRSADNNWFINLAVAYNRVEIVRMLLADKRVDPSTNYNFAIRLASFKGFTEIVRQLLADKRVDPSAVDNYAIKATCILKHSEINNLLLKDSRISFWTKMLDRLNVWNNY
jgi:hypothetical protein